MTPWITKSRDSLLHLFYPHTCAGCGSDQLDERQSVCFPCETSLPFTQFELYPENPVEKIFWGRLPLQAAYSLLYFTQHSRVQKLLHEFKYRGDQRLGHWLGRKMGQSLLATSRFFPLAGLIPLPLHKKREQLRGFNQALLLCEGIAAETALPVYTDLVIRTSATATQTRRSRWSRWENMSNRFLCPAPATLAGKHWLLVDDVVTTGATLEACGMEILKAEGASLSVATLAYTIL